MNCLANIDKVFDKPGTKPGYLLWQLTHVWQRFIKQKLDTLGITHVQFALLKGLYFSYNNNLEVHQSELAQSMNMNVMMTSQVLRTLEKKKLIARVSGKNDSRSKVITFTNQGLELMKNASLLVDEANKEFFSPIENELEKTMELLTKLIDHNEK